MQTNKIYNMDCIEGMKQLEDNSVDSIVTDPPYELGFMGKSWDASGIAYNVEMWKEAFRVLKPGGYLLSFGGTRTYHRMACAIEDAGFEIRDQIQWVYGSGFPKSLNIGKAIDKLQGNERIEVGLNPNARNGGGNVQIVQKRKDDILTKGTSEWEGWGTALKPANEPICVARKPLGEKTVAENVLKWGTGGINIDDCRVGFINDEDEFESKNKNQHSKYPNSVMRNSAKNGIYHQDKREPEDYTAQGRFPANVIHDGSDEVLELFPDTNPSKTNLVSNKGSIWGSTNTDKEIRGHNDLGGSAARFFYCAKASKSERNAGLDGKFNTLEIVLKDVCNNNILWTEKNIILEETKVRQLVDTGKSLKKVIEEYGIQTSEEIDLNIILFGKLILEKYLMDTKYTIKMGTNLIIYQQILNWLHPYIINEHIQDVFSKMMDGGSIVVNVINSNILEIIMNEKVGLVLGASPVVLKMQFIINEKEKFNIHPTIKPLKLMQYLVRLVTPKGGVCLDPFMGSGTTAVACKKNGFNYLGFDMTKEYVEIAEARIKATECQKKLLEE